MKTKKILSFIWPIALVGTIAIASPPSIKEYHGAGYTIIQHTPISKMDLSQDIVRNIKSTNIYDGLQELLKETGWRLSGFVANDPQYINLLRGPWPQEWKLVGPDTLENILRNVGGDGWQLVVDPVNRLIGYEVKAQYK